MYGFVLYVDIFSLGDAAHPMSPFKGQGANQALLDASSLANALAGSVLVKPQYRDLSDVLFNFEKEMCNRSKGKVIRSRYAAVSLHSAAALTYGNMTRAYVAQNALHSTDEYEFD